MKVYLPISRSKATLFLLASLTVMIVTSNSFAQGTASATPDISSILKYYNNQIYFTQNAGQFSAPVLYRADFPLGQAVATQHGMIISTFDPATMNARQEEGEQIETDIKNGKPWRPLSSHLKGHAWMMNFQNSSAEMNIEAKDVHSDVNNYMNSSGQHSNVNSYAEVWYKNVYNNVDVRYYPSQEASLEYDIICKPGFDKNKIAITFDGIETMSVAENGHLVMHTSVGDVDFPAPVVYQKINGEQKSITASFVVTNNNVLSFNLGEYDASQALVIDPIALRWATWVNTNSSGDNHGHCIWVDPSDGAIYMVARVVGTTDQITVGAFDESANGNLEMIVGKYTEPATIGLSGTRVWQTYIGGSGDDNPYAMEQGPDGNLYITGYTSSTNFPLIGGTAFNGGGASIDNRAQTTDNFFILKINKLGNSIKSSVIGGNGDDGGFDLRINESGDIVICGNTQSTNLLTLFPGSGASNTNNGNIDACVFKINADLSSIAWIKNYGGSGIDQPTIMVQDISSGDIFVGGYTTSTNFPTTNPRQSTRVGTKDGFIQKLNSAGATRWSSYFNSDAGDSTSILCMEFNTTKNQLYFGGITSLLNSANISVSGVYDNGYNGSTYDFFVCRMDTNQNFVASTYLGGSGNEVNMMGLNTDLNNDVYVFGYTNSTNFPVTALPNTPLQTTNLGSNDKVFLKLNSTLSTLNFSTYYGGSADDYDPVGERGIKFSNCRIYTIVTSKSNNIPLTVGGPNVTRISTTPYEPGLVVWANPPDLAGNTINDDQTICYGAIPTDLIGSVPSYVLPTISRNGVNSAYPSLGSAATYQWQRSIDNGSNWTNIAGATNQNLLGTDIGQVFVKTIFRRIIGGDACILPNAADQTVTVTIITVTASNITPVSCTGGSNGSITASTDGTNPTYLWSNGATTQTISGLTAGSYSVTVTSNNGCSTSGTFTVTEPNSLPSVSITPTNPTCVGGGSNGSACANASGGTGAFTYLWSNGATTQCATGLSATTYNVTVTDANGCTANNSTTLTLPSSPTVSISGSLSFCAGSSTQLCAPGGFDYSWSTGATTQCISVNTANTWSVTVTDANGCTGSASASTTINQNPSPSISGTLSFCAGSSTQICAPAGLSSYSWSTGATTQCISVNTANTWSVTVTDANGCSGSTSATTTVNQNPTPSVSGSLSFCAGSSTQLCAPAGLASYLWSTGATTQCISVNTANTWTVTVTDANGCSGSASATTTVNQNPTPSISGTLSFCAGSSTQLCAPAGFDYSWSTGATTQCITVSSSSTLSVTVTDANGCSGSNQVTTIANPVPTVQCSSTPAICGTPNGTASVNASGGTGALSYSWSNGGSNSSISGLAAGPYSVTVSDANQCSASCSTTVASQGSTVSVIIDQVNQPTCNNGGLDGSMCANVTGATGVVTYVWSPSGSTQCLTGLGDGTYSVSVTDGNGCAATAQAVTIARPVCCQVTDPGSIAANQSNCGPFDPAALTSIAPPSGGLGTLEIIWIQSVGCTGSWTVIPGATGLSYDPGVVTQTTCFRRCSRNSGCTSYTGESNIITITVNPVPTAQCSSTPAICGTANGTASVNASGGTGALSYSWSNGGSNSSISGLAAGPYTVTVTDANQCSASCTSTVGSQGSTVSVIIDQVNQPTCNNGGLDGSMCANVTGATGVVTYVWSPSGSTQCLTGLGDGTYSVSVTDGNGCSASSQATTIARPVCCQVTDPGSIAANQSNCGPFDPAALTSIAPPSGGLGTLEIIWIQSVGCTGSWTVIPGATGLSYDPGVVTQTTCFRRCSRNSGCTSYTGESNIITITVNPVPTAQCSSTPAICGTPNGTASVNASGGTGALSYSWSNGGSNSSISGLAAGPYSVTVSDANQCSASCSTTVASQGSTVSVIIDQVNQPTCNNGGLDGSMCANVTGATGVVTYVWSPSGSTQCLTGLGDGTYSVSVTDGNGCAATAQAVTIARPVCCQVTDPGSIAANQSNCGPFDPAALTSIAPPSGGLGTLEIIWIQSVGCTGSWTVIPGATGLSYDPGVVTQTTCFRRCSRNSGCTSYTGESNIITITVNPVPTAQCSSTPAICGTANGTASVNASGGTGALSYSWSNGGSNSSISGLAAGPYTVTVSDANQCSASCTSTVGSQGSTVSVIIDQVNQPTCNNGGLDGSMCANVTGATGVVTYVWSPSGSTQCLTGLGDGTYSVSVTDGNGCTASSQATTIARPVCCQVTDPGSIAANQSNCGPFDPAALTSIAPPSGGLGTLQIIWIQSVGCTGSWTVIPGATGLSYDPGVVTQTTCFRRCSRNSGCTSYTGESNIITITVNPTVNTFSVSGNTSFCPGGSTQLCAPAGFAGYSWSTGATTQCITVGTAATFTVTVTNASGCTGSASATTTINQQSTCNITGNGSICAGSSTQWCAPAGMSSYAWSTGATTQCITVSTANTYSVTITNANGCTSTCSKTLVVNSHPTCAITGNGSVCAGGSTQWCAPGGMSSYAWSTGATTQCITVSSANTYSVTITNANGCTSTCSKTLVVNALPTCAITGNGSVCAGGSTQWCAPGGMSSYAWSTGATTQCITVSSANTYSVTITNANGCTSTCSKTLTVNAQPSCSITGNSSICAGGSTQLCAPAGMASYSWSTGATTQCITVTAAGTYTVTITGQGGCTSTCNKCVTVAAAPSCTITVGGCGNNNTICQGGTASLCAPSGIGYTYTWSNGSHSRCINVTAAGTYSVTVTNSSGCSSTCSKTIYVSAPPSCTITVSGCGNNNTICQGGTASLCAPAGIGYTYTWSNGSHSRCINVTAAGTYSVTVTNSSGCSSTCSKTIYVSTPPSCTITVSGCGNNNTICQGGTASLCAPAGNGYAYTWSNGAHTSCINVTAAGTYSVTVTNSAGCSSTCSKTIYVSAAPSCNITVGGCGNNNTICQGGTASLCAPSGIGYTYTWSNGSHSPCINVTAAGTYSVTVTNSSGCSSTCSKTIYVSSVPSCTITVSGCGNNNSICQGGSASLCAPSGNGYTYTWSNGSHSRCITVCSAGTYTVTVTNSSGCSSTCSKTITVSARPSCTISGNTVIQQGQCTQLCAPSGIGYTYTWSNGSHSRCITVSCAGTYSVTVTNSSGCSSTCSVCVTVVRIHCRFIHNPNDGTLTAVGEEGKAPYSYVWHTESGETTPAINVKSSGEYAVTVTDADGATVTEKYVLSLAGIEASVYPNPFVSSTTIQFRTFNKNSNHAVVEIYAIDGSKVATIFDGEVESGKNYMVKWNADAREGIYMYRIICGDQVETGRMKLISED